MSITPLTGNIPYITFNGFTSKSLGLYVGGQLSFNSPQRDVTKVSIPGRNGDLIRDNGRFYNVQIAYNIVAMDDFDEVASAVKNNWLSAIGYKDLISTYDAGHTRKAALISAVEFETGAFNKTGKAQIIFDCKPQRFIDTSATVINAGSSATLTNPTMYDSKPLFTLTVATSGTATGSFKVGNQTINVLMGSTSYLYIDSELMDCWWGGGSNANTHVTLGSAGFPIFKANNSVTIGDITGCVQKVTVAPNWWEV